MLEEGSETSNGIRYEYIRCTNRWFFWQQVTVPRSFLDNPGQQLETEAFDVGGHAWSIRLDFGRDGNLGAVLCSQNESDLNVHLAFTLVNRDDKLKSVTMGNLFNFHPKGSLGYPDLESIAKIKHQASGYLFPDGFVIKFAMRLKGQENERCFLQNDRIQIWALKDMPGMSPWVINTEELTIGEHKWQLQIYPNGKAHDSKHLSFFVKSCNESDVKAQVRISVLNQCPEENDTKNFVHTFSQGAEHGYSEFLKIKQLKDKTLKFQKDGWMILALQICTLNQKQDDMTPSQGSFRQPSLVGNGEEGKAPLPEDLLPFAAIHDYITCGPKSARRGLPGRVMSLESWSSPEKRVENDSSEDLSSQPMTAYSCFEDSTADFAFHSHPSARSPTPVTGDVFADRYVIVGKKISGKPHIQFAKDNRTKQNVVLKFYREKRPFSKSLNRCNSLSTQHLPLLRDSIANDGPEIPSCLVFEKGDYTLDKWIQIGSKEFSERKEVVTKVLECLNYIHSFDIVHGDINPSNIAYFESSSSWKLLNTDEGVKEGEQCGPGFNLEYAAPERMQAEATGQAAIVFKSMDMFSFGIVAFEALTGKRFYGPKATEDVVKEYLSGKRELPSLGCIEDEHSKALLSGLLRYEPERRWTAETAHTHLDCGMTEGKSLTSDAFVLATACLVKEKTVTQGAKYNVTVTRLHNLMVGKEVESKMFSAGGRKWRICLLRPKESTNCFAKVVLISCDNKSICAHIRLHVQLNDKDVPDKPSPNKTCSVAEPFGIIACRKIRKADLSDPAGGFQSTDVLSIDAEFGNVDEAKDDDKEEQKEKQGGSQTRKPKTVHLEILKTKTVKDFLNRKCVFGLESPHMVRSSDLYAGSMVRPWACQNPDYQYWLCRRNKDGDVYVEKFLNKIGLMTRFETLSEEHNGGMPWVTLFREEKQKGRDSFEVDENTRIVFCKIFSNQTPTELYFVQHRTIHKEMKCSDLLSELAEQTDFDDDENLYSAYLETSKHTIRDITFEDGPLPECEDGVCYMIILTERDMSKETVQEKLVILHKKSEAYSNRIGADEVGGEALHN